MRLIHAILGLVSLSGGPRLTAETLTFEDYGFSIMLPTTWNTVEPTPEHALALVESKDGSKRVLVMASRFAKDQRQSALEGMFRGATQRARSQGMEVQSERDLKLDGVSFRAFDTRNSEGVSILTCMGVAGETGFSLLGTNSIAEAGTDSEIMAVVGSFDLLSTPNNMANKSVETDNTAFRFGELTATAMTILFVIGVGIIVATKGARRARGAEQDEEADAGDAPE